MLDRLLPPLPEPEGGAGRPFRAGDAEVARSEARFSFEFDSGDSLDPNRLNRDTRLGLLGIDSSLEAPPLVLAPASPLANLGLGKVSVPCPPTILPLPRLCLPVFSSFLSTAADIAAWALWESEADDDSWNISCREDMPIGEEDIAE